MPGLQALRIKSALRLFALLLIGTIASPVIAQSVNVPGLEGVFEATAPAHKTACIARGGIWGGTETGRGRISGCNLPTKDAAAPCKDSSQCQSLCLQQSDGSGRCHAYEKYKGCGILVRNGQDVSVLCVD